MMSCTSHPTPDAGIIAKDVPSNSTVEGGSLSLGNPDIISGGGYSIVTPLSPNSSHTSTKYELPQIRGVEVTIVVMVLLVWVGAIMLFFNRWGKIRMLLPYQPDYKETQLKVPGTGVYTASNACPNQSTNGICCSQKNNVFHDRFNEAPQWRHSSPANLHETIAPKTTVCIVHREPHQPKLSSSSSERLPLMHKSKSADNIPLNVRCTKLKYTRASSKKLPTVSISIASDSDNSETEEIV